MYWIDISHATNYLHTYRLHTDTPVYLHLKNEVKKTAPDHPT